MADWALIKNHVELWKDMDPQYFYVQAATVENMETAKNNWRYHVRLVLQADRPGIFRVGDLKNFPDVSAEDLNYVVSEMIEVEREKARTALTLIQAHPEAVEERLIPLRAEACELFGRMEEADEDEMEKLSARFNFLTDEEQKIRYAYSLQNPWVLTFMRLGGSLTHETAIAALDHIGVIAIVDDPVWLASPVYPSAGKYNKGMEKVIGVEVPGASVPRDKDGRKKRRVKNLIYTEPNLLITDLIPVPRFYQYRDYLPQEWMNTLNKAAEAAGKEADRWVTQNDVQDVPCYRKRRKSRS